MGSHHDERYREGSEQPGKPRREHPGNGPGPVYFRAGHRRGAHQLREQFIADPAWPMSVGVEPGYELEGARHNLEQVGYILERMELDRLDIIQLRDETRAMLAGMTT
jgi:hypothetical protein